MSDGKTPVVNAGAVKSKPLAPKLKDTAILGAWIASLLLISALCWVFTQPLRSRLLLKAVNRVLEDSGDPRRLGERIFPGFASTGTTGTLGAGVWYTLVQAETPQAPGNQTGGSSDPKSADKPSADRQSTDLRSEDKRGPGSPEKDAKAPGVKVLIFTFVGEGTFFPCAAVVTQDGKVKEFIPLTGYGQKVMKQVSSGILRIYTRRIEGGLS